MSDSPPTLDPRAAQRWLARQGATSPWLHEEVGQRMAQRLEWIVAKPADWLSWHPSLGGLAAEALVSRAYPQAQRFRQAGLDQPANFAPEKGASRWWSPQRWRAAPAWPQAGVGMVWANMALHTAPDPMALLAHWHQSLAVDGFVMFSCLGPDTLRELRSIYAQQGWGEPAHAFTDMHDWGDMLVQTGFAEPVMDMERIVLSFETPQRLLQELRELGRNLHVARFAGLRGRQWQAQLHRELASLRSPQEGGPMTLTFEIVYGHAYKPAPRLKVAPQTSISLGEMRQQLQKRP